MKELTYILGAGASYESIPVVATFPKRFNFFSLELVKTIRIGPFNVNAKQESELIRLVKKMAEEFNSHQSFDTYFKKLFHTGENEMILQGKKILTLYFLWEHIQPAWNTPYEKRIPNTFYKTSVIDKRYDALIAGLLKPHAGSCDMFTKVNLITWNYDLNLFYCLKNYYGATNQSTIEFKEKISENTPHLNLWNVNKQISIMNMNGYFYSQQLKDLRILSKDLEFEKVLLSLVTEKYFEFGISHYDAEMIEFAWESSYDANQNILIVNAKKAIENSSDIVVIGYTFPLYNRLIDIGFFNKEVLSGKKIFIQDPNADIIADNIKSNFALEFHSDIVTLKDCSSFFVPPNIFSPDYFERKASRVYSANDFTS